MGNVKRWLKVSTFVTSIFSTAWFYFVFWDWFAVSFIRQRWFVLFSKKFNDVRIHISQCEAEYVSRTYRRLDTRINNYIPASIRLDGLSHFLRVTQSAHDSVIEQHWINNLDCEEICKQFFQNFAQSRISSKFRSSWNGYIKLHQQALCKQKDYFLGQKQFYHSLLQNMLHTFVPFRNIV